jgi:hypothetical protein
MPGGSLITSFRSWPLPTASRQSAIASRCQLGLNFRRPSSTFQASGTKSRNLTALTAPAPAFRRNASWITAS